MFVIKACKSLKGHWGNSYLFLFLKSPQLLMCGTGDINVQDFKAHAVIVGGSWHFREKVSPRNSVCVSFQQQQAGQ